MRAKFKIFQYIFYFLVLVTLNGVGLSSSISRGYVDLSKENIFQSEPRTLNGKWLYAPHTHFPEHLENFLSIRNQFTQEIEVPGNWKGKKASETFAETLPKFGFGSYLLKVKVNPQWNQMEQTLGFRSGMIHSTARIRVWDELGRLLTVLRQGGTSQTAEGQRPSSIEKIIPLPKFQGNYIYILLETSNFIFKTGGINSPPQLGNYNRMIEEKNRNFALGSILVATCFIAGFFNLMHFFQELENKTSLAFALFCFTIAIRECTTLRFFELIGLPETLFVYSMNIRLTYASMPLIVMCAWLFYVSFKISTQRMARITQYYCAYAGFALVIFIFLTPLATFGEKLWLIHLHLVGSCLLGAIELIKHAYAGNKIAIKIISAFFILFVGVCNDILYYMQIINTTWLSPYTFVAFILTQSAIISGISAQAQRKAKHSYKQLAKVFYPHQIALMEAGKQLEESMPIGSGEACVISFDIVGSSRLRVAGTREFLRNVFGECGEIMIKDYSSSPLRSNAFRVKEMGDGFICTLGFPLPSPEEDIFKASIDLSSQFLQAFKNRLREFAYHEPIYCGIGIGFGAIEAFFPESTPIEYDLYGHGIVMAKRYEQMRKILFEKFQIQGNVIIIQELVYEKLSEEIQNYFEEFVLDEFDVKVRDDPSAKKLFYKFDKAFSSLRKSS